MIRLAGIWQDGRTSGQTQAVCRVYDNGRFRIERVGDGQTLLAGSVDDIRISPRVADTPRHLHFASGEKLETDDHANVDRLLRRCSRPSWLHRVYRLESRMAYVLLALAAMLLFLWAGAKYGIPAAARLIAFRLPVTVLDRAGRQTLNFLDRSLWEPSTLDDATRDRLRARFRPALAAVPEHDLQVVYKPLCVRRVCRIRRHPHPDNMSLCQSRPRLLYHHNHCLYRRKSPVLQDC